MAEQHPPQSYTNHTRRDPRFLAILIFLFLNLGVTVAVTIRHWPYAPLLHLWLVAFAVILFIWAALTRSYATRLQDRIIRLEERLRLAALLPPTDHHRIAELTTAQLVALRFASDAELPALVHRTLAERLEPKAIKQSISAWRADHQRV